MYSARPKIGKVIAVWSCINGLGSTSTTAAMIASRLSASGPEDRRVLMYSTDSGPYGGAQILSPAVQDNNTMGNLLLVTLAGGLQSDADLKSFTIGLTKNLDALCSSGKAISDETVSAYRKMIDRAATLYDYVVVDAAGELDAMTSMVLAKADIVMLCVSQNMKHLTTLNQKKVTTTLPVLADKNCGVIITRYSPLPYLDTKQVCKMLSCSDVFLLSEDMAIHKNVCQCTVLDFVSGLYKGIAGKQPKWRKRIEPPVTAKELDAIVSAIENLQGPTVDVIGG